MFGRGYYEPGDVFAGFMMFLIIALILAVLCIYVGYIVLIIVACIALVVGSVYALYIYIKNFIAVFKTLSAVSGSSQTKTFFLRWGTFIKETSIRTFKDNISVAKSAISKSHTYKFLSPKKWFWIFIALVTMICGTLLIVGIILLQLFIVAFWVLCAAWILLVIGLVLFCTGVIYAVIITVTDLRNVFGSQSLIFGSFNFTRYASISDVAPSIKAYFYTMCAYMRAIWSDNLSAGQRNANLAANYKIYSPRRYFLFLSVGALCITAIFFDALLCIFLSVVFIFELFANLIWVLIVKLFIH